MRERLEDIAPLARHFLNLSCAELGRDALGVTQQHIDCLMRHDWPGNIRELKNVLERAVILSSGRQLRLDLAMPEDEERQTAGGHDHESAENRRVDDRSRAA